MDISQQILNTQKAPSLSQQILSADKGMTLSEQILYSGTKTPEEKILDISLEGDTILSPDQAEEATAQSKHLYGENAPEIYTQQDLEEANEYEATRVLEENDMASINKTLSQVVSEGVQQAQINRAAAQSAWDHFLASEFHYDGGLRASDLKQHQAEAIANQDFTGMPMDALNLYQDKLDRTYRIQKELIDKTYERGLASKAAIFTWNFAKNIVPLSYNAVTADRIGAGFLGWFTPVENAEIFHSTWQEALTNPELSGEQYELLLRNALDHYDIAGTTYEDMIEYVGAILGMDTGTAFISAVADASVIGGVGTNIVTKGLKYGPKAAGYTTVKSLMPYLTPAGAKSVLRAGSSPIKTARKLPGSITDFVTRKRFVGGLKGAIDEAAKKVGGSRETAKVQLKEALGQPDIVNILDKDGKVSKTVLENVLSENTQPVGSFVSNVSASEAILTTKAYNRTVRDINQAIQFLSNTSSVAAIQEELKSAPEAFANSIKKMLWRVKDDIVSKKKVGDIVKSIPADELRFDNRNDIVFRVRLPAEFKSIKSAQKNVVDKLNKTYAQYSEIVPLTNGKYAVEVDFNTHKGFGTLLLDTTPATGTRKFTGQIKSAMFTASGTPTAIRSLDYVRSANVDLLARLGKDTKDIVKGLSRSEKMDLEFLLDLMTDASKPGRYSQEILKAKGFNDRVINAYSHTMLIRDVNFLIVNEAERVAKTRAGLKQLIINGKELGEGVLVSPGNPEEAIRIVTGSGKKLIIGNVDALPVDAQDLVELAQMSSEDLMEAKAALGSGTSLEGLSKTAIKLASNLASTKHAKEEIATQLLKEGVYADAFDKIRKGEFVVFRAATSTDGATAAEDILYVLPKNSVVVKDLPAFVLNYVPGWNRYYDRSAAFVKQARVGTNGEILGVNTIFSSTRLEDLQKTVDAVEAHRQWAVENDVLGTLRDTTSKTYKEKTDALKSTFSDFLEKHPVPFAPYTNLEEFVKWSAENRIDITNASNILEIVKNDQVPSIVKAGALDDGIKAMQADTVDFYKRAAITDAINSEWKARQAHRYGGSVLNYDFKEATHVDVDKTLQYLVDDMISEGVMSRYEEVYSSVFGSEFRKTIAKYVGGTNQMSDAEILKYTDLEPAYKSAKSLKDKEILSQAITAQKNYAMLRGIPCGVDSKIATFGEGLLRSLGATADALHIPQRLQGGVRASFEWFMDNVKPIQTAQAIAAHRFLGCLNIVQATKNFLGPASLIVAAEGTRGLQALKDVFGLIHRLHGADKDLMAALKKLDTSLGSNFKESDMIFRNLLLLDTHSAGIKGGLLGAVNHSGKFARASLFFFNRADLANRVMAFDVALRKFGFDKKMITKASELGQVGSYADSLYINMSKRGLSRVQSATWSKVFLQFTGYMMKYAETMLFDTNLTPAQRRRMFYMTMITSGGMGLAGTEVYNALAPSPLQPSDDDGTAARIVKEAIQNGVIDTALKENGFDVSVQNLFGPGLLDKAGDFLDTGLLSILAATPAVQTVATYFDAARDLGHFMWNKYAKDMDYLTWSGALQLLLNKHETVASTDRLYTAITMYRSGLRYAASGQLTSDDNTKLQALLMLLGLDSQKIRDVYLSQVRRQTHREDYQAIVKKAQQYADIAARGGEAADVAQTMYDLTINDDTLSPVEKMEAIKTTVQNAISQSQVPLSLREFMQSEKSKIKTGERTLY